MLNYPIGNSVILVSKAEPGKFVAVHRKEAPEKVCFPGGKLDPGEDVVTGAVREILEETGLVIDPHELRPVYVGVCEGIKEYWVTVFIVFIEGTEKLESPEPEMRPFLTTKEEFMKNTSFPLFNQKVFKALEEIYTL